MRETNNPFQITTPEDLTAQETVSLFVDVLTDFQKIIDPGHVFLIGPRGTGKSMMFRFLQPDCQCLDKQCRLKELPFLGIYVPLKDTNFTLAELKRVEHRHASEILNEHILVTHFCMKIFNSLAKPEICEHDTELNESLRRFYENTFVPLFCNVPLDDQEKLLLASYDSETILKIMSTVAEKAYREAFSFTKALAFRTDLIPYEGPLFDYSGYLLPLLSAISKLSGFPSGPVYLLVDDAHWLGETQAQVLNSWVATRTSRTVSLKISTQYNYKTYYTVTGATIDTPHDFMEIDISTIYTGNSKSKYRDRIEDIVNKRLEAFGIKDISAQQFFPDDEEQEAKIKQIEEGYKKQHDAGKGRGYYRSDDALRYARPDFIKSLAGQRKSSYSYSYAGFNQLVNLSSGIVRHFLTPAHLMYAETKSRSGGDDIRCIPPSIQDEIIREEANCCKFENIERLLQEGHADSPPKQDIERLSNLIEGLGGLFRQILLSDRSERRVFSIAFSDKPSEIVERILNLGVQLGYFQKSTIGRKDSRSGGRTRLFVLNRRLAPLWTLDPNGFSGYLFVTNALVEEAMQQPISLLRRIVRDGLPDGSGPVQLELF